MSLKKLLESIWRKWCKLICIIKLNIYCLITPKKNNELKDVNSNWKYYKYLKKKYANKVNKGLKGTHQYSNKVWWCWLQGEENAPELNKACLKSLRKHLKDREITIITNENLNEYIEIPEYIVKKHKKGLISHAHFSDIIRLELLIKYGGTWIDSSVYCTGYDKYLFDRDLFAFSSDRRNDNSIKSSNWFITSEINNPILIATRDLLYDYWKKHNFLIHYYIFHFLFTIVTEEYKKEWSQVPVVSNIPPHLFKDELLKRFDQERFEYIKKMTSFHKLNQKIDFSKAENDSFYNYIIEN